MELVSIPLIAYAAIFCVSLYFWKKRDAVRFYWYLYPIGAAILLSITQPIIRTFFDPAPSDMLAIHNAIIVASIFVAVLVGYISLKKF